MSRINYQDFNFITTRKAFDLALKDVRVGTTRKKILRKILTYKDFYLHTITNQIKNSTYTIDDYNNFWLRDGKKVREISAPTIKEIWTQRVIYNNVYPVFEKQFINDSHGCRKGKGTHSAILAARTYLKNMEPKHRYLKLDIRKYFYAINHEILFNILEKTIKDSRYLDLISKYFKSPKNDFFDVNMKGLPLGNLLSQLFGLIYLNELDNFIKRELKIKHYVRYVDDFILFNLKNPEEIESIITEFLYEKLDLTISKRKIGFSRLNFLGYSLHRSDKFFQNNEVYKKSFKKSIISTNAPLIHMGIKRDIDYNLNHEMNKSIFGNYIDKQFSYLNKNELEALKHSIFK